MSDNVKIFPKTKRASPEELYYPVFHECMESHTSMNWMLQIREGMFRAVCTDCAADFSLTELIDTIIKDEDDDYE